MLFPFRSRVDALKDFLSAHRLQKNNTEGRACTREFVSITPTTAVRGQKETPAMDDVRNILDQAEENEEWTEQEHSHAGGSTENGQTNVVIMKKNDTESEPMWVDAGALVPYGFPPSRGVYL